MQGRPGRRRGAECPAGMARGMGKQTENEVAGIDQAGAQLARHRQAPELTMDSEIS